MLRKLILSILLISAGTGAVLAAQEEAPPEVSLEGLEQVEKWRRGAIHTAPGVNWNAFDKVQLEPASVTFRKNWQRDQNRNQSHKIRQSDMDRISSGVADVLDDVFRKELADEGGFTMTDEGGSGVLRMVPVITDLNPYAPDPRHAAGIQRTYAESAGSMRLTLHLYDGASGELIASGTDWREANRKGYMELRNSVTNTVDVRNMMRHWAGELIDRLEEARSE